MTQRRRHIFYLISAIIGALLSLYALRHHILVHEHGQTTAVCNHSDYLSCDAVALSKYSAVGGVPVAALGLMYFLSGILLSAVALIVPRWAGALSLVARSAAWVAAAFAVVLMGVATFQLRKLCPVCVAIDLVIGVQVLLLLRAPLRGPEDLSLAIDAALATAIILSIGFIIGWSVWDEIRSDVIRYSGNYKASAPLSPYLDQKAAIDEHRLLLEDDGTTIVIGPSDAPVRLTEFIDFGCPNCAAFHPLRKKLEERFGKRLQIVIRHYPADATCNPYVGGTMHDHACLAAKYAICAFRAGRYSQFEEAILNEGLYAVETPGEIAKNVGIDPVALDHCVNSPEVAERIAADIEIARKLKVPGTPTLLVNGVMYVGPRDLNGLTAVLSPRQAALK